MNIHRYVLHCVNSSTNTMFRSHISFTGKIEVKHKFRRFSAEILTGKVCL